eukprot:MONOS_10941.1-p1 / transcript=MONOS_10941.1 / gene=MONOS_10941 / organism=Monocercomonoides_exilis_PA203 / gene_product=unspecified product / transcript_product=unspecified product / location=Mono_scaffold00520:26540-29143(-) / protein_length=868 / sequence_SO=supercontig / SO=protein_coding / is_pseudo=false
MKGIKIKEKEDEETKSKRKERMKIVLQLIEKRRREREKERERIKREREREGEGERIIEEEEEEEEKAGWKKKEEEMNENLLNFQSEREEDNLIATKDIEEILALASNGEDGMEMKGEEEEEKEEEEEEEGEDRNKREGEEEEEEECEEGEKNEKDERQEDENRNEDEELKKRKEAIELKEDDEEERNENKKEMTDKSEDEEDLREKEEEKDEEEKEEEEESIEENGLIEEDEAHEERKIKEETKAVEEEKKEKGISKEEEEEEEKSFEINSIEENRKEIDDLKCEVKEEEEEEEEGKEEEKNEEDEKNAYEEKDEEFETQEKGKNKEEDKKAIDFYAEEANVSENSTKIDNKDSINLKKESSKNTKTTKTTKTNEKIQKHSEAEHSASSFYSSFYSPTKKGVQNNSIKSQEVCKGNQKGSFRRSLNEASLSDLSPSSSSSSSLHSSASQLDNQKKNSFQFSSQFAQTPKKASNIPFKAKEEQRKGVNSPSSQSKTTKFSDNSACSSTEKQHAIGQASSHSSHSDVSPLRLSPTVLGMEKRLQFEKITEELENIKQEKECLEEETEKLMFQNSANDFSDEKEHKKLDKSCVNDGDDASNENLSKQEKSKKIVRNVYVRGERTAKPRFLSTSARSFSSPLATPQKLSASVSSLSSSSSSLCFQLQMNRLPMDASEDKDKHKLSSSSSSSSPSKLMKHHAKQFMGAKQKSEGEECGNQMKSNRSPPKRTEPTSSASMRRMMNNNATLVSAKNSQNFTQILKDKADGPSTAINVTKSGKHCEIISCENQEKEKEKEKEKNESLKPDTKKEEELDVVSDIDISSEIKYLDLKLSEHALSIKSHEEEAEKQMNLFQQLKLNLCLQKEKTSNTT